MKIKCLRILGALFVILACLSAIFSCNNKANGSIIDALRSSDGYLDSADANRLNKILTDTTLLRKPDFPPDTTYLTDTFSIKNYPLKEYIIRDKNFFRQLDNVIATNVYDPEVGRRYVSLIFYDDVLKSEGYKGKDSFYVVAYLTNSLSNTSACVKSDKFFYVTSDLQALSDMATSTNKNVELEEITIELIEQIRINLMAIMKYENGHLTYMKPDEYKNYYYSIVE